MPENIAQNIEKTPPIIENIPEKRVQIIPAFYDELLDIVLVDNSSPGIGYYYGSSLK
jgi:hypothetical protein